MTFINGFIIMDFNKNLIESVQWRTYGTGKRTWPLKF